MTEKELVRVCDFYGFKVSVVKSLAHEDYIDITFTVRKFGREDMVVRYTVMAERLIGDPRLYRYYLHQFHEAITDTCLED